MASSTFIYRRGMETTLCTLYLLGIISLGYLLATVFNNKVSLKLSGKMSFTLNASAVPPPSGHSSATTCTLSRYGRKSGPHRHLNDDAKAGENYSPVEWLKTQAHNVSKDLCRIVQLIYEIRDDETFFQRNKSYFMPDVRVRHTFASFLIDAAHVCQETTPFLLVVVPSVEGHYDVRNTIRTTWGRVSFGRSWPRRDAETYPVKLLFFFGIREQRKSISDDLKDESDLYGDIVVASFADNYRNLSLKVANMLYWSTTFCPRAKYVLKVDEDTFVNIPLLLDLLALMNLPGMKFVLGHRHHHWMPEVVRSGKWSVREADFPFDRFPAYVLGHSYVISCAAVRDLLFAFQRAPLISSEDALFTGVLAKIMRIPRIASFHFASVMDYSMNIRCGLPQVHRISQTGFKSAQKMYDLWTYVVRGQGQCDLTSTMNLRNTTLKKVSDV